MFADTMLLIVRWFVKPIVEKHKGEIEMGELAIAESGEGCRLLPAGIFARWFVL
jgi:hypothetical protein